MHIVLLVDVLSLGEGPIVVLLSSVLPLLRGLVLFLVSGLLFEGFLGVDETLFDVFLEHVSGHLKNSLLF
jgi:hypothetical protein